MKRFYTGFEGPWTQQNVNLNSMDFPINYLRSLDYGFVKPYRDQGSGSTFGNTFTSIRNNVISSTTIRVYHDQYAPTVYSLSGYPVKRGTAYGISNPYETGGLAFAISAFRTGFYGKARISWHTSNQSSSYGMGFGIDHVGGGSYGVRAVYNIAQRNMNLIAQGQIVDSSHMPDFIAFNSSPNTNRAQPYDWTVSIKPTGEVFVSIAGVTLSHNIGYDVLSAANETGKIYFGHPGRGAVSGNARIDDICVNDGAVKLFFEDLGGTGFGAQGYATLSAGTVSDITITDGGRSYTGFVSAYLDMESFDVRPSLQFATLSSGQVTGVGILSGGEGVVGNDTDIPNVALRGYNWSLNHRDVYNAGWDKSGVDLSPASPADALLDYNPATRARSSDVNDELGYMLATKNSFLSSMDISGELGSINFWLDSILENVDTILTTRVGLTGSTDTLSASIVNLDYPLLPYTTIARMHTHDQYRKTFTATSLSSLQTSIKVLNV